MNVWEEVGGKIMWT